MNVQEKVGILLVDDQPANLLALEVILGALGEELFCSTSGEEAVKLATERDFAAILLDVRMPGFSGFETAKLLRAAKRSSATPIIFITAADMDDLSVIDAYALGAVDYLTAPLVPQILRAKVAAFVELFRLRQAERQRAEAVLRDREERFKLLVNNAQDFAVVMLNAEGNIIEWSPGAKRMMGWTEAEALNRPASMFYTPGNQATGILEEEMERAARSGRAEDRRWHQRKDGRCFYAEGVLYPVRSPDGTLLGFGKLLRDRTEQRQAEQELRKSEAWLQTVTDSVPAIIAFIDRDLCYRFVNRAFETWFGLRSEEILGRQLGDFLGTDQIEQQRPYIDAALSGRAVRFECPMPKKGLGTRITEVDYTPHFEGGMVRGFFVLLQDITDQKNIEQSLRKQERKKDEFLAMLAHELRNPLAPIRSSAEVLRLRIASDPVLTRVHEVISRQVGHLSRLLDDLLDVSRITRGKINLKKEVLDLVEHAGHAVSILAANAAQNRVTLDPPPRGEPVFVEADPVRLEQMVGNAISNAIKFTQPGGRVAVSVSRDATWATIRVRDNGVGIAPEYRETVFELFAQTDRALDRQEGGLGIGLTVLRALAELHGGRAELLSEGIGFGCELVIQLPALSMQMKSDAPSPTDLPKAVVSQQILVVDDNRDGADSLAQILQCYGHQVECAYDGIEALASAARRRPEVVICDIGLPKVDGYEVVKRLRAELALRGALCIALTGYGDEKDKSKAVEAGYDYHLTKPIDPQVLLRFISSPVIAPASLPKQE